MDLEELHEWWKKEQEKETKTFSTFDGRNNLHVVQPDSDKTWWCGHDQHVQCWNHLCKCACHQWNKPAGEGGGKIDTPSRSSRLNLSLSCEKGLHEDCRGSLGYCECDCHKKPSPTYFCRNGQHSHCSGYFCGCACHDVKVEVKEGEVVVPPLPTPINKVDEVLAAIKVARKTEDTGTYILVVDDNGEATKMVLLPDGELGDKVD